MKARHLQHALVAQLRQRLVGRAEKVVEVEKVVQHLRMDQQGGVDQRRVGGHQCVHLVAQLRQQGVAVGGLADHVAHLPPGLHGLGEGAEVEPDHGAIDPGAGLGQRVWGRWNHLCEGRHGSRL